MAKRRNRRHIEFAETKPAAINREELTTERASIQSDPCYLAYLGGLASLAMRTEDPVLLAKGGAAGWAIYEELLQDPHTYTVWNKRIRALQAYPWEVIAASEEARDVAAAVEVRRQFGDLGFDRVTADLMDGFWKGFATLEALWAYDGARLYVQELKTVPQRRFRFYPGENGAYETRLITRDNTYEGEPIPERKFLRFTFGHPTNPNGHGLASRAWWPIFFKKQGIRFWMVFAEKYGSPTAVGKAPKGMGTPDREKLLQSLKRISQDAGIVINEDEGVSLLESAQKGGSIDCYEGLVRFMDEQLSEMTLGETGSTNQHGGGGSRARDQVGNEVRLELAQADSDLLCDGPFAELSRWITDVNFPGARPPKVRRLVKAPTDLRSLAERDKVLAEIGWRRTAANFQETFGEGWERCAPLGAPAVLAPGEGPAFAEAGVLALPSQALANLAAGVALKAGKTLDGFWKGFESLVDQCSSMAELKERLPEAFGIQAPELSRLVEETDLAAQLIGRNEVHNAQ